MKKRLLSLFMMMLLGITGCGLNQDVYMETPELVAPVEIGYDTVEAKLDKIRQTEKYDAYVTPLNVEEVFFTNASFRLKDIYVSIGQQVQKGDLIAELDVESVDENIMDKEEYIERIKTTYEFTNRSKNKNLEILMLQLDDLEKQYDIYQQIKESLSQSTIDSLTRSINLKKASIESAELDIRQTLENQEFELQTQARALKELEAKRVDSEIFAPISGTVIYTDSAMKPDARVTAYKVIASVADFNQVCITCKDTYIVPSFEYANVYVGDKVFRGEFLENENEGEELRVSISGDTQGLKLGSYAMVQLVRKEKDNALVIPYNALNQIGSEEYVYTIENDVKVKKIVKTGFKSSTQVEIVEGLEPGDNVFVGTSVIALNQEYETKEVIRDSIIQQITARANAASTQSESLYFDFTEAKLVELNVQKGTNVQKGDPIATVIPEDVDTQIKTKTLELEDFIKDYEYEKVQKIEKIDEAKEEIAKLQQEYAENQYLDSLTKRELEQDLLTIEQKKISLSILEDNYESYLFGKDYTLKTKQESLKELKESLQNTTLYAPFDGKITSITDIKLQQIVKSSDLIVTVSSSDTNIAISSADANTMCGMISTATLRSGNTITAEVLTCPYILPEGVTSKAATLKITDNPSGEAINSGTELRMIMTLRQLDNVLVIDPSLVFTQSGRKYVYIMEDGIKKQRCIQIGLENEKYVQVLEGLEEGDLLIVNQK